MQPFSPRQRSSEFNNVQNRHDQSRSVIAGVEPYSQLIGTLVDDSTGIDATRVAEAHRLEIVFLKGCLQRIEEQRKLQTWTRKPLSGGNRSSEPRGSGDDGGTDVLLSGGQGAGPLQHEIWVARLISRQVSPTEFRSAKSSSVCKKSKGMVFLLVVEQVEGSVRMLSRLWTLTKQRIGCQRLTPAKQRSMRVVVGSSRPL